MSDCRFIYKTHILRGRERGGGWGRGRGGERKSDFFCVCVFIEKGLGLMPETDRQTDRHRQKCACVCVSACVYVRACVRVCVCARVCVCVLGQMLTSRADILSDGKKNKKKKKTPPKSLTLKRIHSVNSRRACCPISVHSTTATVIHRPASTQMSPDKTALLDRWTLFNAAVWSTVV